MYMNISLYLLVINRGNEIFVFQRSYFNIRTAGGQWTFVKLRVSLCQMHVGTCHVKESSIYFSWCLGIAKPFN